MNPKDRVAIVIAAGLVAWGLCTIGGIWWNGKSLSEGGGEILLAVAGGLTASLTAYFATKNNGDKP